MQNPKPNKPPNTDLAQQRLIGFSLSPSPLFLSIFYFLLGMFFLVMGVWYKIESDSVKEIIKRYDDIPECKADWRVPKVCSIELKIEKTLNPPVFIYYEITNMYQNHRKYSKNRDVYQLMGTDRSIEEVSSSCSPVNSMEDTGFYTYVLIEPTDVAGPCGLIATSLFNDSFSIIPEDPEEPEIEVSFEHIAWDVDKQEKFKNLDGWEKKQWTDVENEHFMVWMSIAGLPTFRKLWGRVDEEIERGVYRMVIFNNYDVSSFDGEKRIILTSASRFGGKFYVISYCYFVCAGIALVGSMLIILLKRAKIKVQDANN